MVLAFKKLISEGKISESPIKEPLAAISVGINKEGKIIADLNYEEDSSCEADVNLVATRSGKFIEIQFNGAGFISGASIRSYLLEKSRVVRQSEKERSFHIFYQFIAGASAEQKKTFHLTSPSDYGFIKGSSHTVKK